MKAGLVWLMVFALLPAFLFGLSWRADITFQDSDESRTILWGLATDATDGFDIDVDENFPLIPRRSQRRRTTRGDMLSVLNQELS